MKTNWRTFTFCGKIRGCEERLKRKKERKTEKIIVKKVEGRNPKYKRV